MPMQNRNQIQNIKWVREIALIFKGGIIGYCGKKIDGIKPKRKDTHII
jgi:hypothetical protein